MVKRKRVKNIKIAILLLILCILLCVGCIVYIMVISNELESGGIEETRGTITTQLFKKDKLKNADAKLMSNGVVTSINRKLTFIDFNGNIVKQYVDSDVSWLDVCEDRVIVYGNNNKEVGICVIDENYNIISNNVIMNIEERLGIDPAICKVGNDYYITVTHITGAVNNGNPDVENGNYSVRMYKSSDLKSWVYVSEVLNYDTNLEDIDLNYYNGKFVLSYEKETFDKLNSSICVTTSKDMGKNWSGSKTLIEANADNEPASLVETREGYCLYYSSDIEELGGSYETSKVYSQALDKEFNKVGSPFEAPLINQNGDLLYDVSVEKKYITYLFTEKYITQSNLILERIDFNR